MGRHRAAVRALQETITRLRVKLYTAKRAVTGISEVLECFGGAGYVENTGLPKLLRDSQVLSIWEGTTNVLSLDALRAIEKERTLPVFFANLRGRLAGINHPELVSSGASVEAAVEKLLGHTASWEGEGRDFVQAGARAFAYSLAGVFAAALLLEHAQWAASHEDDPRPAILAKRWCARNLVSLVNATTAHRKDSRMLIFA